MYGELGTVPGGLWDQVTGVLEGKAIENLHI